MQQRELRCVQTGYSARGHERHDLDLYSRPDAKERPGSDRRAGWRLLAIHKRFDAHPVEAVVVGETSQKGCGLHNIRQRGAMLGQDGGDALEDTTCLQLDIVACILVSATDARQIQKLAT